jgi:type 1 fimbria pilin
MSKDNSTRRGFDQPHGFLTIALTNPRKQKNPTAVNIDFHGPTVDANCAIVSVQFFYRIDLGTLTKKAIMVANDHVLNNTTLPQWYTIRFFDEPCGRKVNILSTVAIITPVQDASNAVRIQRWKEYVVKEFLL